MSTANAHLVLAAVQATLRVARTDAERSTAAASVAWHALAGSGVANVNAIVRAAATDVLTHTIDEVNSEDFSWREPGAALVTQTAAIKSYTDALAGLFTDLVASRSRSDGAAAGGCTCARCGNAASLVAERDRATWVEEGTRAPAHDDVKRILLTECGGCLACYHVIARALRVAVAVLVATAVVDATATRGIGILKRSIARIGRVISTAPGFVPRPNECAPYVIVTIRAEDVAELDPELRRIVKGAHVKWAAVQTILDDEAMTQLATRALAAEDDVALKALLPPPETCDIAIVADAVGRGQSPRVVAVIVRSLAGCAKRRPWSPRRQKDADRRYTVHQRHGSGRYGGSAGFSLVTDEAEADAETAIPPTDYMQRVVTHSAWCESHSDASLLFAQRLFYVRRARGPRFATYEQYTRVVADAVMKRTQLRASVRRGAWRTQVLARAQLRLRGGLIMHNLVTNETMRCGRNPGMSSCENARRLFPLTALGNSMSDLIDHVKGRPYDALVELLEHLGADEKALDGLATGNELDALRVLQNNDSLRDALLIALETSTGLTINRYACALHEDGQSSGGCELSTVHMLSGPDANYTAASGAVLVLELGALAIATRPGHGLLSELHEWLHCSVGGRGSVTECLLSGPRAVRH